MRLTVEYHSNFPSHRDKLFVDLIPYLVLIQMKDKEELEEVYVVEVDTTNHVVKVRPMSGGPDLLVRINDIKKVVIY